MEKKGFSRDDGPTGVMLCEHELGRHRVAAMVDAVAAGRRGDLSAAGRFAGERTGVLPLLRNHIEKEDHCLFAMADQVLSETEQQELLDAFARADSEHSCSVAQEDCVEQLAQLADRLGVSYARNATFVAWRGDHR